MAHKYSKSVIGTASEVNPIGVLKEDIPVFPKGYFGKSIEEKSFPDSILIKEGDEILMMGCAPLETKDGMLYGTFKYDERFIVTLKLETMNFNKPFEFLVKID